MGNKKKRTGIDNFGCSSSSNLENWAIGNQSELKQHVAVDTSEIKQETIVKEEQQLVGALIEVPRLSNSNIEHFSYFSGSEDDFDSMHLNEIKVEMKKESEKKHKVEAKKNDDLAENQQDEHLPSQCEDNPLSEEIHGIANKRKRRNTFIDQKNASKKHKCGQCEYSTQYKYNLRKHLLKHTGEKPFGCDYCVKQFTRNPALRAHMKVHIEDFLFHCSGCLQGFDEKNKKTEHELSCKARCYECHLCKKSFGPIMTNFKIHMQVHTGDKPFKCIECIKKFSAKAQLNRHMNLHAGLRLFRCSKCRTRFSQQDKRNSHEEKCNRRIYECYVCGKVNGILKSQLKGHMHVHTGRKPFECQYCLKCFNHKAGLFDHQRSHTKKLPFKCSICRQGFSKQNQRKAHEKNCNRRWYECHLCQKFSSRNNTHLKIHMRKHSGRKPFKCELCQIGFSQEQHLVAHSNSRIHEMKCKNSTSI